MRIEIYAQLPLPKHLKLIIIFKEHSRRYDRQWIKQKK
jgi:hypothetical protein